MNPSSDGWTLSTHLRQEKAAGPTTPGPLFVGPPVGHAVGPPAQLVGLATGLRPVPRSAGAFKFWIPVGPSARSHYEVIDPPTGGEVIDPPKTGEIVGAQSWGQRPLTPGPLLARFVPNCANWSVGTAH